MKTPVTRVLLLISTFVLVACGGGGGDNGGAGDGNNDDLGLGNGGGAQPITATAEITQENVRTFAGSAYTFVDIENTLINNFTHPLDPPSFSSSRNGSSNEECFGGGTLDKVVSENGAAESFRFQSCQLQSGMVLNGGLEIATSNTDADDAYDIEFDLSNLSAQKTTYSLNINGGVRVVVPGRNEDPRRTKVISNLQATSAENSERYFTENFQYELYMSYPSSFGDAEKFSGGLGTNVLGTAVFKVQNFDIGDRFTGGSNITGVNDSFGVMQRVGIISDSDLELLYFATSDQNFSSAGVRLSLSELREEKFNFFTGENTPPQRSLRWNFGSYQSADLGEEITISSYSRYMTDYNGDLLITGLDIWNLDKGYGAEGEEVQNYARVERAGYDIQKIAFKVPGEWEVSVTAVDSQGEKLNLYFTTIRVIDSRDTDGDGIINENDLDDDNDGVLDSEDAFPLDATEDSDTDGDNIGNNADTDDDNDGVVDGEDAYPLNSKCALASDGDGEFCYLDMIFHTNSFIDSRNIVYYWDSCFSPGCSPAVGKIIRWNMSSGHFLAPLELNHTLGNSGATIKVRHFSEQDRAVVIFSDTEVVYFDLAEDEPVAKISSLPTKPYDFLLGYYEEGNYLIRVTRNSADNYNYAEVFDSNFVEVESAGTIIETSYYYIPNKIADYSEKGYTLNRETVTLEKFENDVYIRNAPALVFSPDNTRALDSSTGSVYQLDTLEVVGDVEGLGSTGWRRYISWTTHGIVDAGSFFNTETRQNDSRISLFDDSTYALKKQLDFPETIMSYKDQDQIMFDGDKYHFLSYRLISELGMPDREFDHRFMEIDLSE